MDPARHTLAGVEITDQLISELLRTQAPEFAHLEIGRYYWRAPHHVTVRIGDDYAVRLPREGFDEASYRQSLEWLKTLAPGWSFTAQVPVVLAEASPQFGLPWEIVPWYDGVIASYAALSAQGAAELGIALKEIHQHAPHDAPRHRETSVSVQDLQAPFDTALRLAVQGAASQGLTLDADHATTVWREAVGAPMDTPHCWIHGALDPRYVISDEGRLKAIIEWRFFGAGDPALDLGAVAMMCGPTTPICPPRCIAGRAECACCAPSNWWQARGWSSRRLAGTD